MQTTPSRILIVDDEADGREILADLLDMPTYVLDFAHNGIEACAQARLLLPDLILLDVMMPYMDGYAVCQELRSTPETAEIPIVMLTALEGRDARVRALDAGADDFIAKPYDRVELRARVRSITRLNRYRTLLETRRAADEQARIFAAELERAYDATLEGWSRALDLRDKETEGHSRRVTDAALALAKTFGMSDDALVHMQRGALLHDIGKVGIPDSILLKPGPLSDEEWAIMKMHPVYAHELLSPIPFLHPTLDIPYCHHERWDGTGYPRGLSGEDIPIAARIFAVVDVWDALRSDRPYRMAWSEERVYKHIASLAGTHFDPAVVDVFLRFHCRLVNVYG